MAGIVARVDSTATVVSAFVSSAFGGVSPAQPNESVRTTPSAFRSVEDCGLVRCTLHPALNFMRQSYLPDATRAASDARTNDAIELGSLSAISPTPDSRLPWLRMK